MSRLCKLVVMTSLVGLLPLAACALPGVNGRPSSAPTVVITNPVSGPVAVVEGDQVLIESTATDARGVAQIELYVDGQLARIDASPESGGQSPYVVAQPWTAQGVGEHTIVVRAANVEGGAAESAPLAVTVSLAPQGVGQPTTAPQETPAATPTVVVVFASVTPTVAPPTATRPPTATPSPTRQPTPPLSTPTPPATEPPPATLALTATPTLAATFADTGLRPEGRFLEIWTELEAGAGPLGFPSGAAISDRDYAKQYFQRGVMYWWDRPEQPGYIWVFAAPNEALDAGDFWRRYDDAWDGGDRYSCAEAREQTYGPVAGFGRVWCDLADLREMLGRPIEPEAGSAGNPPFSQVQFFQGGALLYNPLNGEVWVLFATGGWQRRPY